jgi:hypothetical protein
MANPTEQTFLNEAGVIVTQARFMVSGQTYAMNGVTSVASLKEIPSRKGPIICLVLGLITFFGALRGDTQILPGSLFFLIVGGLWWYLKKTQYTVLLHSASGESRAFTSADENLVDRIVGALNEAIVARG